jgi:hypothetical protein
MGGEPNEDKIPDEEDEETELDRDKGPTLITTPRMDTTPMRSDRLAEPEKKPVDMRKVLQSRQFLTRVGVAGGSRTPDEYEASGSIKQVVWWAHNTTGKLTLMESHRVGVARTLSCGLASVVEVLKQKFVTYDRMDNLHNQREKDLKRIKEL